MIKKIGDTLYYIIGVSVFIWLGLTQPFPLGCQGMRFKGVAPGWVSEFRAGRPIFVVSGSGEVCREQVMTADHVKWYQIVSRNKSKDFRLDQYITDGITYYVVWGAKETRLEGGRIVFTFDVDSCHLVAAQIKQLQPERFK